MLGTLVGALEVRQVKLTSEAVRCEAEGVNVIRDGLPVLVEIRVRYRLAIPAGSRETVERALARHAEKCPTASSLRGAVAVTWSAELEEAAPRSA
jgi:uncharacterized OsmC-like protein